MNDLYIKVVNGKPELQPYTAEQVRNIIYETSNMLLPAVINNKLMATFNYYPVEIKHTTNLPPKEQRYATNEFKRIYSIDDVWYVEMEQVSNPHLLQQDWDILKKERNRLLLETDWIQISDIVTPYTKKQYIAYRELIRDIFRVAEYPSDVKFPKAPDIQYIEDVKEKQRKRIVLTSKEYESIRNFNNNKHKVINWNIFLTEWSKLNYIMDKAIVQNLIAAYTDTTLENIINHD